MDFQKRRKRLRKLLKGPEALLVTNETNVRYLTGFTGDSTYLLVAAGSDTDDLLISDPRYEEQLEQECPDVAVAIRKPSDKLVAFTADCIRKRGIGTLAFEPDSVSFATYQSLAAECSASLVAADPLVEQLRAIKDADEIRVLKKAVAIAERGFLSMRARLRPELTETEFAHQLESCLRELGAERFSFTPIVAGGPRAALPHGHPAHSRIGDDPLLLVDWGAEVDGYRSDLTRVLMTSRTPAKISKAYEAVRAAQQAAIEAIRPGATGGDVDRAAREVLSAHGVERRFTHGLGHGIGLDIHEAPRMGKGVETPLKAGMVVTVEPGVYFPGLAGIRIEDDILVTSSGAERLSSLPVEQELNQVDFLA